MLREQFKVDCYVRVKGCYVRLKGCCWGNSIRLIVMLGWSWLWNCKFLFCRCLCIWLFVHAASVVPQLQGVCTSFLLRCNWCTFWWSGLFCEQCDTWQESWWLMAKGLWHWNFGLGFQQPNWHAALPPLPPPPPHPHLKMWLTLPTLQTSQQQAGWQDSAVASFPQRKWLEVLIQSNEEHYIFKSMSPMFLLIWKWWHYFMSFPFLCNNCFTCQWHSRLLYPNRELLLKVKEVSVEISGLSLQLHVCVNMRMCSSETVSASGLLIKLKVISFNFCRYDCWCFM